MKQLFSTHTEVKSRLLAMMTFLQFSFLFGLFALTGHTVAAQTCNPNDPTAANSTSFCAPTPVCASGNFIWSQTVDPQTGSISPNVIRLVASGTEFFKIPPSTFPSAFSGPVTITVTDVVSYDGYINRDVTPAQPHERWYIRFDKGPNTVGQTPLTGDVPDGQNQGYWRGPLGTTMFFPNGFDEIVLIHESFPNQQQDGQSVVPVSVCINYSSGNGSIGNFVWNDVNGNGIQDGGELGISGATVKLLDAACNAVIATTTTDGSGNYLFPGLPAGTYGVEFVTPAGFIASPSNQGGNDGVDSDPIGGKACNIVLVQGENNLTIDAGFFAPGALGDRVWNDIDGNGIQGNGEPGIPGVTVRLLGANCTTVLATTTTDVNGDYRFNNLPAGTYGVEFVTPAGMVASPDNVGPDDIDSDPVNGKVCNIELEPGETDLDIDAGFYATGSIGDRVWNDFNNNGIQDPGEPGLPGVTVRLLDTECGSILATTTTDASGNYSFPGLAAGTYGVEFVAPAGFMASPENQGGDDALDSDPENGKVCNIELPQGGNIVTVDAGFYATISLGNLVWEDTNGNGLRDGGEPGIDNAEVCLFKDDNNDNVPDGAAIATTNTDGNGIYEFSNLLPGNYIVAVTTPAGYVSSPVNGGDPDNDIDNDDNGLVTSGGKTYGNAITLTAGGEPTGGITNNTYDFGFIPTLTITCPPAVTVAGCTTATGVNLGTPTVTGGCSATPTVTNNAPSAFPVGQTIVTWTVNDGCGNTATCTQLVTVTGFSVTLGPDRSLCNGPVTLTATTSGGVTSAPPPSTPFTEVSGSTADMRIFSGNIDHITLGNSFSQSEDRTNCGQIASTSKTLTIPSGAVVKKAYLFWSGSGVLDNKVKLNGTLVTADATKTVSRSGGFYYFAARKDVTSLVTGSGTYTVNDLAWSSGSPYCYDNSAYGAWAMTVIYEKASLPSARIHVNTEKFTFTYPAATYSTTINNLSVPAGCNADAKLTIVAFEGDNYKTEKLRINGVLDPNYNNFRGQSGPNLDIVTKNAPSVTGGTTSLTYSIQSWAQSTVFGTAIEGLFDYVKVLKYNNCPSACSGISYLWNTGATTQSISNVGPGTYIVTVTDCAGCVAKDTVVVTACPPVLPDRCYKIVARHSGKALTIKGNSTSNCADAEQRSYGGLSSQIFKFEEVQTGYYRIINENSGLSLEVTSSSTSDGAVIQQNVYTGASNQRWSLTQIGSYFSIKAKHSNKAMYVKGGSTSNGAVVEQRGSGTNTCSQWSIIEVDCPAAPRSNQLITDASDDSKDETEEVNEPIAIVEPEVKTPAPAATVNLSVTEIVADNFKVHVYPNPASHEFSLMVNSRSNEPITIRIMDMNGVVRSVHTIVAKTNNIKVGKSLNAGIYTAEIVQGKNRQLIKLIKLD